MRTLDGIERTFDSNMCLVTDGDGSHPIGIGGIMGGAETEISFSTKNVLIECAWFEPVAIRRAARFLKLHTEASHVLAVAPIRKWPSLPRVAPRN